MYVQIVFFFFVSVMKANIKYVSVYSNGKVVKLKKKKKFYKGKEKFREVYGDPFIVSNSACGCDVSMSVEGKMLIMGLTSPLTYRNRVTYMVRVSNEPGFRRYLRRIIKGYDCSRYVSDTITWSNNGIESGNTTLLSTDAQRGPIIH